MSSRSSLATISGVLKSLNFERTPLYYKTLPSKWNNNADTLLNIVESSDSAASKDKCLPVKVYKDSGPHHSLHVL